VTATNTHVRPRVRVCILVAALAALALISLLTTGSVVPTRPQEALLLQSGVLLVVLGSLLLERYFTAPADALVNSLTAAVTIVPIGAQLVGTARVIWAAVLTYLVLTLVAATLATLLQGTRRTGWSGLLMTRAYVVATTFGRARVAYSVVFVASVVFFASAPSDLATALLIFWGIYVALWPLGLPQFLSRLSHRRVPEAQVVGTLDRIDSPNLARVALSNSAETHDDPLVLALFQGAPRWCVPLFREERSDGAWMTLAITGREASGRYGGAGALFSAAQHPSRSELVESLVGKPGVRLWGMVREGSTLQRLRIEVFPGVRVAYGDVVTVPMDTHFVHFQVNDVETSEESFGGLNFGSQIAYAGQLGRLEDGAFRQQDGLPAINTLAFEDEVTAPSPRGDHLLLGSIPGTSVQLEGDFLQHFDSHTAVLGATGTGKTELTFDLIRFAAANDIKVICIDLTSQYAPRLRDLSPTSLSVPLALAKELGKKLFDADTGAYGGGAEKRVLDAFATPLRAKVQEALEKFLASESNLGLIELPEISNTKATLWITEMYLSALLELARTGAMGDQRILVVVEEAHTVMPEAASMGLGDFDSKGTVAKITQIALQGRKYGVGLLVVAQRTATVSKSVLTQCATTISFRCIDDTSINFLRNVYGSSIAESLSRLPKLRAVAHGAWIRSENPLTFQVPFDQAKAGRRTWADQQT
jgi:hypothetical protein